MSFSKEDIESVLVDMQEAEDRTIDIGSKLDVFNRVMKYLKEHGAIDEEHLRYYPDRYPFTNSEFCCVFNTLDRINGVVENVPNEYFPITQKYFEYGDICFMSRLMIGQGSALDLFLLKDMNESDLDEFNKVKFVIETEEDRIKLNKQL